jgi:hypothetical protein
LQGPNLAFMERLIAEGRFECRVRFNCGCLLCCCSAVPSFHLCYCHFLNNVKVKQRSFSHCRKQLPAFCLSFNSIPSFESSLVVIAVIAAPSPFAEHRIFPLSANDRFTATSRRARPHSRPDNPSTASPTCVVTGHRRRRHRVSSNVQRYSSCMCPISRHHSLISRRDLTD